MERNPILKEFLYTDFKVNHNISTSWHMNDFHFHDAFEIYFSLSDGVQYFVEDKVYILQKGDLFVLNHMDLHKSVVPPGIPYERYVVTFTPEYIQDLSTPFTDLLECFLNRGADFPYRIHLSEEQSRDLIALFMKAEQYCSISSYGSDIYKRLILAEILLLVNSFYQTTPSLPPSSHEGEYKRVKPILQYIHQHLNEELSLDHLSGLFFLSKYHLGYLFKKATGFSVNEYIITRRIMKARELLKRNLPVSHVGEMVGFHNDSHFIRTFKKMVGLSPKQYAKKM